MRRRNCKRLLAGMLCVVMILTNGGVTGVSVQASEIGQMESELAVAELPDVSTESEGETQPEESKEETSSGESTEEAEDSTEGSAGETEGTGEGSEANKTEKNTEKSEDAEEEDGNREETADEKGDNTEKESGKGGSESSSESDGSGTGEDTGGNEKEKPDGKDAADIATELIGSAKERLSLMAAEDDIASGFVDEDYGHIAWVIDANGKLTVEGTGDFAEPSTGSYVDYGRAPWNTFPEYLSIKSVEVNVSGMTDASYMFYRGMEIINIDLSNFSTDKIENMEHMFGGCSSLASLDLGSFNTSNVTNMAGMFSGCNSLTSLDLGSFNTSNVTNMGSMFADCSSLQNLGLSNFDTRKVTDMLAMFDGCNNLADLNISSFNTSNVTDMEWMFHDCFSLITLDVSHFNTSRVCTMDGMFSNCHSLISLDVSNFDTHNVEYMGSWFIYTDLDPADEVEVSGMFSGCSSLTELNVSNFDTSNVISMWGMFYKCSNLKRLDLSNFNTSQVCNMAWMFYGCNKLSNLDVSNFNTSNVINISAMFGACSSLTELNLSSFDLANASGTNPSEYWDLYDSDVLTDCTALSTIYTPCNLKYSVILPANSGDVWHKADGTTVTELPQNLGYSVALGKNYIPDEPFDGIGGISKDIKWKIDKFGTFMLVGTGDWERVTDEYGRGLAPWYEYNKQIKKAVVNLSGTTDASYMFFNCQQLVDIDLTNFDTSNVTNVQSMFDYCLALTELDMSNLDFTNVSVAYDMLYCDDKLRCIKTPLHLGLNVPLPTTFYSEEYVLFESLPLNMPDSIILSSIEKATTIKTVGELETEGDNGKKYSGYVDICLDETLLGETSKKYNHDIARFSIQMSAMCYTMDDKKMEEVIKNLGFTYSNHETYGDDYKGLYSKYWIASKDILLENKATTVIGVFIRGTSGTEWIDNFEPLTGETHHGFQSAADKVYEGIEKYILDNGFKNSNIKLLITGHSRGAATANLLGAKIDNEGLLGVGTTDNVWVYTFATPNTSRTAGATMLPMDPKYSNIYNIVNPEDFVTKVLPSKWGYGRYGITYVLPSVTTEGMRSKNNSYVDYFNYLYSVSDLIEDRIKLGTSYSPYLDGMVSVSDYIDYVTSKVPDIEKYYSLDLSDGKDYPDYVGRKSLYWLYTHTLAYFEAGGEYKNQAWGEIAHAIDYGWMGIETVIFFGWNQGIWHYFSDAHQAETYLAAMQIITEEELCQPRKTLKGIANCPVDITIYDSDNKIVGQITDNVVSDTYTDVQMDVEEDSKTFYLPAYSDYRVVLSGNDEGLLDYSLATIDPDTGEIERIFYNDLPVSASSGGGTGYTQNVTADANINELVLTNADSKEISPTMVISSDNLGMLTVDVTVEGNGMADSFSNLTPGDYVTLEAIADENNVFTGWYDSERNLITTESTYSFSISESMSFIAKFASNDYGDVLPEDMPEDGKIPDGLWIAAISDTVYTGKAIKPIPHVYDSNVRLQAGTDYTVTYKNNVKASDASTVSTAPTITVTGKGNYSGKDTITFKILPIELTESNMTVADMTMAYNQQIQQPIPSITVNGRKLKRQTDFFVSYPDYKSGAYRDIGTYRIAVTGNGNYTGEQILTFDITDKLLISKASVSKILNQAYTGNAVTPAPVVKYQNVGLVEHEDYELEYQNNVDIGKATVVIIGKGDYAGKKTVSFQITGGSLKKAKVTGLVSPIIYTGEELLQNCSLTMSVNDVDISLKEGKDYTVTYKNNIKAGTAKVIYTGINGYTGTLQKSYKIAPYDILSNNGSYIEYTKDIVCTYLKGGSRPEPDLYFKGTPLKKGVDFTLSYRNNNTVKGEQTPTIVVKGKGSFKNKIEIPFTIEPQNLSNMTLASCDKVYKNKANIYKITPKLLDVNGKALSVGKDFDKNSITYAYENDVLLEDGISKKAGDKVEDTDIIPANTRIHVTLACGSGNLYEGTFTGIYRIVAADIKTAKVSIPTQTYTGSEIKPDKTQIRITLSEMYLSPEDYDIVSYANNIKKGKASVTIIGKGNYGGTKTVKFTIKAKGFLWWWR